MNKGLLTGGAIVAVAAIVGWGAMNYMAGDEPAPATLATVTGTTASGSNAPVTAGSLAPLDAYAGTVTESGGFTGDVLEGEADAPVTVIEYASLTCPHCATFHEQIYKPLKESHIDTGKVKFIFRDFPLNNPAIAASIVARCGGKDRYVAFVDLFMDQQERWTRAQDWMGELQKIAKFGGLSTEEINACLQDQSLGQSVIDRYRAGSDEFKVNSTPTLIIDGETYTGDMNAAALSEFIDAKL